jgi:hypothetical protein
MEYKDTIEKFISLTMNSLVGVPTKPVGPKTQTATGEGAADSEQPNIGGRLFAAVQRGNLGTKISMPFE